MFASTRLAWLLTAGLLTLCSSATAQLPLADVAKLARVRAERSRPAQQKALEPYWADLVLDYKATGNQQYLDPKIAEIAALGDSVVPVLLEKLTPTQGGESSRHLAANCRRVLERLDPASFLDALVELANGTNEIGRTEAIRLLGLAQVPQAATLLTDLLDRTSGEDKRLIVRSLRLLKATSAAPKVVPMLASVDRLMREEVLNYLIATKPAAVADVVVQALGTEKDQPLLKYYVEYFAGAVRGHDAVARALLPLLDGEKFDWNDRKRLVQALATIAPADHAPTTRRLHELIDTLEVSSLEVQAALTLRALGDAKGVTKVKRNIDDLLRKATRRKEAGLYEQRGNLSFGTEEYGDALAQFERMLEFSDGPAMTRRAYIALMKCEARRKKTGSLTKLMRDSGLSVGEIEAVGADDAVFAETLQQEKVRAELQKLAKEQAPR